MKSHYVNSYFEYKGFGIHDSFCGVEIWEHKKKFLVILTQPTVDSGTSITNACEDIATKLYNTSGLFKRTTLSQDIIWVEHYPTRYLECSFPETFDRIEMVYEDGRFKSPKWTHIGETFIEEKKLELLK